MGEVARFDTVPNCEQGWAEKVEEGEYVLYEDYAKLEAEAERLEKLIPILISGLKKLPGGHAVLVEWDRARAKQALQESE